MFKQKYKQKMYYTKEIMERLKADTELRLRIALALKVSEQAVINNIKKRAKTLLNVNAVNVIKEYTGLKDPQIFTHASDVQ